MKRQALTGWYCDALPDGSYAILIPDSHIATSRGDIPLPGRNVLFLVCGIFDGILCLAGQGGDDGQCWVWNGAVWRAVCQTYGTSPCAFHPAGSLYVSMPGNQVAVVNPSTFEVQQQIEMAVGARGIAAVDQFGVHSVDSWYGGDLAEFVDLQGIRVGQDWTDGCAIQGHLLEPGVVYFIRAHRDGDKIAVALWKPKEAAAVCFWFSVSEILSLPLVVKLPPPVNPPIPTPVPEPPRPPAPKPVPVEPLPNLRTAERYWFGPNIDSDFVTAQLDVSGVDVYALPVQWILEDARYAKAGDFLLRLRRTATPLAIEMGSIKPGDYHTEKAQADLSRVAQRVTDKGHQVGFLSMDEPLTGVLQSYDAAGKLVRLPQPVQPLSESVFAIFKFIEKAREVMPGAKVGWLEAWPNIDLETMRQCLMGLDSWGCRPDYWHLDIDWHLAAKEKLDIHGTIARAKQYADDYQIALGVFFAGYPTLTDAAYVSDVLGLAHNALSNRTDIDHICIQSWATRGEGGPQDIPATARLHEALAKVREEWQ